MIRPLLVLAVVAFSALVLTSSAPSAPWPATYRIDHVTDGDTVVLRNGQKVRLVQIDTPEVFFGTECYGPQASARTKGLLQPGTRVRLLPEPATDRIDDFGRLLRYVVRVQDAISPPASKLRLLDLGVTWRATPCVETPREPQRVGPAREHDRPFTRRRICRTPPGRRTHGAGDERVGPEARLENSHGAPHSSTAASSLVISAKCCNLGEPSMM